MKRKIPSANNKRKYRNLIVLSLLVLLGLSQIGGGLYINAKASVANWLMADTWQSRTANGTPDKPWPWADTWIVARLSIPRLNVEQFIMQDASGESLAFGPGATDTLTENGYNILAGHRDTHFSYLNQLQVGDTVEIETYDGQKISYQITTNQVIDVRDGPLRFNADSAGLSMITCWPMDAVVPGGPLRYIVSGKRV